MRNLLLTCCLFLIATFSVTAQDITGLWTTYDEKTNKEKSVVEIYKKDNMYFGKVVKLINPSTPNPLCVNCKGTDKNKPIIGLVIINDLKEDPKGKGKEFTGGKITDPQSGKQYKLNVNLADATTLKVRGFIGISLAGRTQTWTRK